MSTILLKNVRGAFLDLFVAGTPPAGSTSGPKFGGNFIFAPGSDAYTIATTEFRRVATEKFGANADAILAELGKDKKCIRKGDSNLDKAGVVRNGFAGQFFIVAKNKIRPVVVDRDKTPLVEADGKPYSGCYMNVTVDIFATNKPGQGPRVDASLLAVQFVAHGDSFGGSKGSADAFDMLPDEGEAAPSAATADLF